MTTPSDLAAIQWAPWQPTRMFDDFSLARDNALDLAESWLDEFGLSLMLPEPTSRPDAWAKLDGERFAFRIDSLGKYCVLIVTIDYDADEDSEGTRDLSTCRKVEVLRA